MPVAIIVGAQWGDEGKGHVTDLLAAQADIVARYSGGDNAGHTVALGDEIFKLHLIPSGIVQQGVTCVLGNGMVINPEILIKELDGLADRGIDVSPSRLKISRKAHLISPVHVALDRANEISRGEDLIGTTLRGIGPAYTDKAARVGLRAGILADPQTSAEAAGQHVVIKNKQLTRLMGSSPVEKKQVASQFAEFARRLAPYLANTSQLLNEALAEGKRVLAEGAQGTLLDLDHGTYPFVTSSWPTAGGALIGLGIGPVAVDRVIGVAKAFTSRVGSGPFPCELHGESALRLRGTGEQPWDEYGTTTGRPRRVGWLDAVILRYAARVNGLTELALTKLDILTGLAEIPVCVAYEVEGETITELPTELGMLARCRPIFQRLPGWQADISAERGRSALPATARGYVDFVSQTVGLDVTLLSVGPGREHIIRC